MGLRIGGVGAVIGAGRGKPVAVAILFVERNIGWIDLRSVCCQRDWADLLLGCREHILGDRPFERRRRTASTSTSGKGHDHGYRYRT